MSNSLFFYTVGLSIFVLSLMLVRIYCIYAQKQGLLVVPNKRSSHQDLVPAGGGIVFVVGWILTICVSFVNNWCSLKELLIFIPGTLMVSIIGYWDDHKELTAKKRLIAQVLASILCVAVIGKIPALHLFGRSSIYLGNFGIILTLLGLVWSTNLYNFMDGLDGIAAIEGLFVFGVGGLLFWQVNAIKMALLVWTLIPIIAGFLVWNWPKAKIFMGDVGSYCLGFLVALFSLLGDLWYNIPVTFWFIIYGVFWFDATITVIRRFLRGENLAVAHREFAFQRLQRTGLSHVQVLYRLVIVNTMLTAIVIWGLFIRPQDLKWGLLLAIVILIVSYCLIEKLKPMERVKS